MTRDTEIVTFPREIEAAAHLPAENVPLTLLCLAGPIIATMISHTVMSFVDFVMVSTLGTQAQAAIAPAGILVWLLLCFGVGVLGSVNTFVSQSLGRGRLSDCSGYAWQGVHLALLLSVLLLPCWWLIDPILKLADHAPRVMALEDAYIKPRLVGLFPIIASVSLANFFNGIHRPSMQLIAVVVANVFNFLANYALIFGHFGFPAMGIAGAAWATVAASAFHVLMLFGFLLHPHFARTYGSWRTWRIDWPKISRLVWFGLPIGLYSVAEVSGWTFFTFFLIGQFGTVQLAANNVCFKFNEISFMPAVGLSIALSAAVGKAIGRRDLALARRYVRWGLGFSVGYMSLIGMNFAFWRGTLIGLLSEDPQVIAWGGRIMLCMAVFQFFDAFHLTYSGALRGAGDTHWPAYAGIALSLVFLIGGGVAVTRFFPEVQSVGPWIMAAVFIVILGIVMSLRYWGGRWEGMEILEKDIVDPVMA